MRVHVPWFALVWMVASAAGAGVNRWTESAPPRGACSFGAIICSEVTAIALDPFDENVLYAAMNAQYAATDTRGVWRSSDGGRTWTRLPFVPVDSSDWPIAIRIAPGNPATIYVLGWYGLYRSVDFGEHWVVLDVPASYAENTDLIVDARNNNTLYIAKENACGFGNCIAGGVYRSDDSGGHWREIGLQKKWIQSLAIDPLNSSTIYALEGFPQVDEPEGRIQQTRNGGGSWKNVTPAGANSVSMVVVDPLIPSTVYAATAPLQVRQIGVFKSQDRAQTWRLIDDDGLMNGGPYVIAIDPAHPLHLLATAGNGQIVRSVDGGETWTLLNAGLEKTCCTSQLVIAPSGTTFHAIVKGSVYHYSVVTPKRRASGR